jgi:hypothetical protein
LVSGVTAKSPRRKQKTKTGIAAKEHKERKETDRDSREKAQKAQKIETEMLSESFGQFLF